MSEQKTVTQILDEVTPKFEALREAIEKYPNAFSVSCQRDNYILNVDMDMLNFEYGKRTKGYGRFVRDNKGNVIQAEYVAPDAVGSSDE